MPTIQIYFDGRLVRTTELQGEALRIGRRPDNDITLDDVAVSGNHAILHIIPDPIFREQRHVEVEDCQSTNGTLVNGERVTRQRLSHGDVLRMGRHELHFRDESVSALEQTAIFIAEDELE